MEYYLQSVEEHSEGKIHMSEPESGIGNVNNMYYIIWTLTAIQKWKSEGKKML